jgi:type II secretory pathway component PulF
MAMQQARNVTCARPWCSHIGPSDGHAVLAVADPMTARRAAQIVLGAGSYGGKLSDALSVASSLPPMAVRMLRFGEKTGQLPALAARVAEFYEAKLQRNLDRVVGIVGPLATSSSARSSTG